MNTYQQLDAWIDQHFDEQVRFLQELIRVPTDTPPGNNTPHAERTAQLLQAMGIDAEKHPVPQAEISQLLVTRAKEGKTVVRLKGGDPLVFGRGGEEARRLAADGVEFEIVPGVSASLAAAACSGTVPSARRRVQSGVKSQSEETRAKVSTFFTYRMSIASMTRRMSVPFLPLTMSKSWTGSMACSCSTSVQPVRPRLVQFP